MRFEVVENKGQVYYTCPCLLLSYKEAGNGLLIVILNGCLIFCLLPFFNNIDGLFSLFI